MKAGHLLKVALCAASLGACANAGTLGDVLGGVLNAPASQANGTIQSVDTRSQQVFVRQSDGSTIGLAYDNRTQVVYNNQNYAVTALEYGDQVRARISNNGNGSYYTDYIEVTQSASNSTNGGTYNNNNGLYSLSGSVRSVDTSNGYFILSTNNGNITVSMPYNPRSSDLSRFRSLRVGDYVQVQGVYLNESRFELRSFN